MARLKSLPSRLGSIPSRFGSELAVSRDVQRETLAPWRKWYKTSRWQKLRWSVLVRDLFTCRRCGRIEADTSQLVADHKIAHRGDPLLFWDDGNLQCLCKPCHDVDKQREEWRSRA